MSGNKKQKDHEHVLELKYGIKHDAPFNTRIYRCIDPECYFYTSAGMLLGKKVKCPMCLDDYIVDRDALMKKKPRCRKCVKSKKATEEVKKSEEIEKRLREVLNLS